MKLYDFDQNIDRTRSSSLKWDFYKGRDIIPLWVADMDFKASDEIITALQERVDHGVFGYTLPSDEFYTVIMDMLKKRYQWDVDRSWIVPLPGVVSALNIVCRAAAATGDEVLVPVPVYPPFFEAPALAGQSVVNVPMVNEKGRLTFDFNELEKSITQKTSLILLCSPHNPGGTVFTEYELRQLVDICKKHEIIICSDEIHCGLVLDGEHRPTAAVCPDYAESIITLMAPSKTYNIPGLGCSFAVISDRELRKAFFNAKKGIVPHVNALGYTAAIAAYRDSDDWHEQLLAYLRENRDLLYNEVEHWEGIEMIYPQSTYLAWIDFRARGIERPGEFFEQAGVGLSDGTYFGAPGFARLNFGCSRQLLYQALQRMKYALL